MKNLGRSKPLDGEINPNHPVTQEFRELWFKLCAILVARNGTETLVTAEEVERWSTAYPDHVIVVKPVGEQGRNLLLAIVTRQEGERLAGEEGGLPA